MKRRLLQCAAVLLTAALAVSTAMAQRPLGVDVSTYQGTGINWTSVRNAGIVYAWAKATESTTITDNTFAGNENNGKAAGVYMGGYHFAHPNLHAPGSEAGYFWGVAGGYITTDGKTLMPMLDMEVFSGVVGASSYSDWANQWCNTIVNNAQGAGVTVKPSIYTSACSACNFNSSISQWLSSVADYNGQNPQTGTPWSVCGNCAVWGSGVWASWQYTSTGSVSGIPGNVDHDVFNGTSSQLVSSMVVGGPTLHDLGNRILFNPSFSDGYELDAWGGIESINSAPAATGNAYWPGWDIARDFAITSWSSPPKGYTLDGYGGLNPFGGQAAATGGPYWSGWDIARALQVDTAAGNKGYVLDGWGAVHPFNGAPAITSGPSWPNWDIARDLVITDYTTGKGYVLDGWGGINPLNGAPAVTGNAYWSGWDIARALVIDPATLKGYTLDGLGALHPFNGAPAPTGVAGFTFDIARDVVITDWATPKGYTLDGYGAWHPFGGAPAVTGAPYFRW